MRTVKQLLNELVQLVEKNPEAMGYRIVTGHDIGKAKRRFEDVENRPTVGHICEDAFMTEKELVEWNEDEGENDKLNAVCIN